jgi:ergothioneine biosynthesis protein EgtB
MTDAAPLAERFLAVRTATERLCEPLEIEDYQLQSMPDCSPPKWHLAHTTWFFEEFVLRSASPDYRPFHPRFPFLFNSYYEAVGERWPRPQRGLLSRPTVSEVFAYRRAITERVLDLLKRDHRFAAIIELGINHEEQHQELLLTDLKHAFGLNPLRPAYSSVISIRRENKPSSATWRRFEPGIRTIGHSGAGFAFDNESPAHRVFLNAFEIAMKPVTNGEFLRFIEAGGYERPELWLSDGWSARRSKEWTAPPYWEKDSDAWRVFTLCGLQDLIPGEPVCHVSYYESDAFARWAGARLPTEAEWEVAALGEPVAGNFLDSGALHPVIDDSFFGNVWNWTASPYTAYPGYRPAAGALGEYNGKFMCNQMVLRGGSCVTPAGHIRPTYRNFFPPDARWQFSGLRLARDLPA